MPVSSVSVWFSQFVAQSEKERKKEITKIVKCLPRVDGSGSFLRAAHSQREKDAPLKVYEDDDRQ